MTRDFFSDLFEGMPAVLVLRHVGHQRAIRIAEEAWQLGFRAIEVAIQGSEDLDTLSELARRPRADDQYVGAGTILTVDGLRSSRDAGASFVVAPGVHPSVVDFAHASGVPVLPGVATATEITAALHLGCDWMKMFPAASLGPDWVRHMAGPFPEANFVATGGIDASNLTAFFRAGVSAVGVGSRVADAGKLSLAVEELRRHIHAAPSTEYSTP